MGAKTATGGPKPRPYSLNGREKCPLRGVFAPKRAAVRDQVEGGSPGMVNSGFHAESGATGISVCGTSAWFGQRAS